jgi:hypothetical protein
MRNKVEGLAQIDIKSNKVKAKAMMSDGSIIIIEFAIENWSEAMKVALQKFIETVEKTVEEALQ